MLRWSKAEDMQAERAQGGGLDKRTCDDEGAEDGSEKNQLVRS